METSSPRGRTGNDIFDPTYIALPRFAFHGFKILSLLAKKISEKIKSKSKFFISKIIVEPSKFFGVNITPKE